jgi:type II secretory pathway pseudopilin PulG
MKLNQRLSLPTTIGLFLVLGAPSFGQSTDKQSQQQTVQISQVPQLARDAAQKVLGTTPTDAKVVVGTSPQEYELKATNKSGKEVKVHVLADGTVLDKRRGHREAKAAEPTPHR